MAALAKNMPNSALNRTPAERAAMLERMPEKMRERIRKGRLP
jgi:hypothetical protein